MKRLVIGIAGLAAVAGAIAFPAVASAGGDTYSIQSATVTAFPSTVTVNCPSGQNAVGFGYDTGSMTVDKVDPFSGTLGGYTFHIVSGTAGTLFVTCEG